MPPVNSRTDNKIPFTDKSMKGKLTPITDLVYIEPDLQGESKTASGLIVQAPKRQGPPTTGKIIAIGSKISEDLKPGMKVVFRDPNARGFWLNGKAHVPLKEDQIIAIIEEKK